MGAPVAASGRAVVREVAGRSRQGRAWSHEVVWLVTLRSRRDLAIFNPYISHVVSRSAAGVASRDGCSALRGWWRAAPRQGGPLRGSVSFIAIG